jgi:hypothetical protein
MNPQNIAVWCFLIFSIIVLLFAAAVLWKIYKGEISLSGLLAESPPPEAYRAQPTVATIPPDGTVTPPPPSAAAPATATAATAAQPPTIVVYTKASLARFQFLVFTFVIAGLYLLLCIEAGTFVDIPTNVLGLLGISGGTYAVGKAVK